ncbi:MAG: hypothetical protein R8M38_02235 [Mariprofundaceae bacterium]
MKTIIMLGVTLLLTSCGLSEGDKVLVLPDDLVNRSPAVSGVYSKADGDTVTITDEDGRFLTFPEDAVYAADDEDALELEKARRDFYQMYQMNSEVLNLARQSERSSGAIDLLTDKADDADLPEWIAYFEFLSSSQACFGKHSKDEAIEVEKAITILESLTDCLADTADTIPNITQEINQLSGVNDYASSGNHSLDQWNNPRLANPIVKGVGKLLRAAHNLANRSNVSHWGDETDDGKSMPNEQVEELTSLFTAVHSYAEHANSLISKIYGHLTLLKGETANTNDLAKNTGEIIKKAHRSIVEKAAEIALLNQRGKPLTIGILGDIVSISGLSKEEVVSSYEAYNWNSFEESFKKRLEWFAPLAEKKWGTTWDKCKVVFTFALQPSLEPFVTANVCGEKAVTRKVLRKGESTYVKNVYRVRYRDIKQLLNIELKKGKLYLKGPFDKWQYDHVFLPL